jgi:hypothetical protein
MTRTSVIEPVPGPLVRSQNRRNTRKPSVPRYMKVRNHRTLHFVEALTLDGNGNVGLVKSISLAMLKEHTDWTHFASVFTKYRLLHVRVTYRPTNYSPILLGGVVATTSPTTYEQVLQMPRHNNITQNILRSFHYNLPLDTSKNEYLHLNVPTPPVYFTLRSFSGAQANLGIGYLEYTVHLQFQGNR